MFPAVNVLHKLWLRLQEYLGNPQYHAYIWWMIRFATLPRFTPFWVAPVAGRRIKAIDCTSFFSMYKSIFLDGCYYCRLTKKKPVILDCGANIGMSVLFFAITYPQARIEAFEADPEVCSVLRENTKGIPSVAIHQQAVWIKETTLHFSQDHADGGAIRADGHLSVAAIDFAGVLRRYRSVSLLKMDIEGAEMQVLQHCEAELSRVEQMFVEYHQGDDSQGLGELLTLLDRAGFIYVIQPEAVPKRPLETRDPHYQVNIFAWKVPSQKHKKAKYNER